MSHHLGDPLLNVQPNPCPQKPPSSLSWTPIKSVVLGFASCQANLEPNPCLPDHQGPQGQAFRLLSNPAVPATLDAYERALQQCAYFILKSKVSELLFMLNFISYFLSFFFPFFFSLFLPSLLFFSYKARRKD